MAGAKAASPPASQVIQEMDLASDTAWTLRCDDAPARPIKVPGGGWNSDQQSPRIQEMKDVKDYVLYERKIAMPAEAAGQVVKLRFGAVAHGCEVFLDSKKVGEHHGPQVPFEMDLTEAAAPGKEQALQVKAYHRRHYFKPGEIKTAEIAVGWDFPEGSDEASRKEAANWSNWHGNSKVGYGIVRSITLAVLPAVHVQEIFVRPSVTKKQLSCDVWLRNATEKVRKLTLNAALSSWNKHDWRYPAIPTLEVAVPAHGTVKITLSPVAWELGSESWWWPNIPFSEDYFAQLHILNISINEGGRVWQKYPQRFGFVEHAEGPFYYMVNGVRVTGFSDGSAEGQVSFYDSYSSPAWLPPTGPGTGAPESWRRYMRVGININRLHCSPPTKYMMEAADEVGFMLIPEAPIWGNFLSRYNPKYSPQTYHDMGRACRNHPCVARYSLANEVREDRNDAWPWRAAIDDMREVDDIHPLTFELHAQGQGKVTGLKSGSHAWIMNHYSDINEKVGLGKGIRGMGEHFWVTGGMGQFAVGSRILRVNDWSCMAGWSWLNYWPNFLQGMSHDLHAWKRNNHADRKDGIDGWDSPIVKFVQRSLHPYLIQDVGILADNGSDVRGLKEGKIEWPYYLPMAGSGSRVERTVAIFNGGLSGDQLSFAWNCHWDKPDGPLALKGEEVALKIEPGFHATQKIAFTVPPAGVDERRLYLVMESRKDGQTVFREEGVYFDIAVRKIEPAATFLGIDDKTQGAWQGKYGVDGYELAGKESKLPGYAKLQWKTGGIKVYQGATDDPRALAYFANPPTGKDRIAAGRYAGNLVFTLDAGSAPHRLSIYHLDYDRKSRKQSVEMADAVTGQILDQRETGGFDGGIYQSWRVVGTVRVTIRPMGGSNATISGVFLDPVEKVSGGTHQ
jgi:hypothetical protein